MDPMEFNVRTTAARERQNVSWSHYRIKASVEAKSFAVPLRIARIKTISIELFAVAKELAGSDKIEIQLPDQNQINAEMVLELIAQQYPVLQPITEFCRLAVNCRYTAAADPIPPGASLALIPPVSGG